MSEEFTLVHEADVVLEPGGDERAIGGAVTVELCGHWEHEPPCRWPHHTLTRPGDTGATHVRVDFTCAPQEEPDVRRRIETALESGALTGPDGHTTTWQVVT